MTTISVTENVKRALLKIASELQSKLGIRVDLNEAIRYLLTRGKKDPNLLEEACRPIPEFELVYKELIEERRRDEERARRKYGV
jgi:predicted CopG family antitoxin